MARVLSVAVPVLVVQPIRGTLARTVPLLASVVEVAVLVAQEVVLLVERGVPRLLLGPLLHTRKEEVEQHPATQVALQMLAKVETTEMVLLVPHLLVVLELSFFVTRRIFR